MEEKTCTLCGKIKNVGCFVIDRGAKDGRFYWCKECANRKRKEYYQSHRDQERASSLAIYYRNAQNKDFRERRNARQRVYAKDYWKRPETRLLLRARYHRRIADIGFRISRRLSFQVWYSLRMVLDRSQRKNGRHWEDLVGWSVEGLMEHLESKFQPGMTWGNYGGRSGWQIDHVVPRSWFKIQSSEDDDFRNCWALENLQPRWSIDNVKKGNRFAG